MRKTRARHNGTRTQLQPEGELLSILMGSRHAQDIDSNRGFPKLQLMTATDHRGVKSLYGRMHNFEEVDLYRKSYVFGSRGV